MGSSSRRPISATAILAVETRFVSNASPTCICIFLFSVLVAGELSAGASISSTLQPVLLSGSVNSRNESNREIVKAAKIKVAAANLGAQVLEVIASHHEERRAAQSIIGNTGGTRLVARNSSRACSKRRISAFGAGPG